MISGQHDIGSELVVYQSFSLDGQATQTGIVLSVACKAKCMRKQQAQSVHSAALLRNPHSSQVDQQL